MTNQAFNPYLPSFEYIPDAEPYVINDRVYIYGSHDRFSGNDFCLNDYVCWSAPIDELGDWRYEGVIYQLTQDPLNPEYAQTGCAPDMQRGVDGRYYLYYALNRSPVISVAVCDTPAGAYEFYGYVKYSDGCVIGRESGDVYNFDPGVLVDDDNHVYLYSGIAPDGFMREMLDKTGLKVNGSYCIELESDMLTIKSTPKMIAPGIGDADGTGFEDHPFFEASSIRKANGKYYFIYSSLQGHELCYAVSDRPDGGFVFGGTLVSIGDIYLNGNTEAVNFTGNTHGSIIEINNKWYVFYHRQTNRHHFSRQACAEEITIAADGSIAQAELTSCGLNGRPLHGSGEYEARIACNLSGKDGTCLYEVGKLAPDNLPYFTQEGEDREDDGNQYIANMRDGSWAGFKFFEFCGENHICVTTRGSVGTLILTTQRNGIPFAKIELNSCDTWTTFAASFAPIHGTLPLFVTFEGTGKIDFMSFSLKTI